MHIPWSDIELFIAVAEAGSLSAAAKALRVTQPTVSRRLAELEATMGEPLFQRTVDGTSITSFGERLLEPARRMSDSARDVDLAVSGAETKPRGVVRLTAPPGVGSDFVVPFALFLRDQLPEIRLEVVSTANYLDLARREADLAIRFRPLDRPTSKDLITLATVEPEIAAYATHEYAAKLPRGYGLADLDWIAWAPPLEHVSPNPQLAAMIPGFRPVFASDDYLLQLRAAEAGVGAIVFGRFRNRLALPTPLVPLKVDLGKFKLPLELVCAKSSLSIPRVRAVADLLARELSDPRPSRSRSGHRPAS